MKLSKSQISCCLLVTFYRFITSVIFHFDLLSFQVARHVGVMKTWPTQWASHIFMNTPHIWGKHGANIQIFDDTKNTPIGVCLDDYDTNILTDNEIQKTRDFSFWTMNTYKWYKNKWNHALLTLAINELSSETNKDSITSYSITAANITG